MKKASTAIQFLILKQILNATQYIFLYLYVKMPPPLFLYIKISEAIPFARAHMVRE